MKQATGTREAVDAMARALTIRQPYASRIMTGEKRHEFRGWRTEHRGLLLVHAGQRRDPGATDDMPVGAIIGVVRLVDIVENTVQPGNGYRWAWALEDPQPFARPIATRGAMSLWSVTAPVCPNCGQTHDPRPCAWEAEMCACCAALFANADDRALFAQAVTP